MLTRRELSDSLCQEQTEDERALEHHKGRVQDCAASCKGTAARLSFLVRPVTNVRRFRRLPVAHCARGASSRLDAFLLALGATRDVMRQARLVVLLIVAAGLFLVACGGRSPVGPSVSSDVSTPVSVPVIPPGRITIISIDGLRPDALYQAGAPNIMALASRGAYSWQAKTILPSSTLPAHISMLTGYTPDVHGVTWDDYAPVHGQILVQTIFGIARAKGLRTAMVVGKEKFAHFRDTGSCDSWVLSSRGDGDVAGQASTLASARPDLLFVHLPDVDLTGHASQWMSDAYQLSVRRADDAVGRIVASLPSDMTIIITADHGGHLSGHGSADPLDTTIPWIIAGPATAKGRQLSTAIRTVDTAATAAFVLGVQLPADASGQPVLEAFTQR
jgi:type I phosphodiesterase/nucleotide pyrophosphatase